MKENAEIGLRKTEVTGVDIRVRQETDWKESLSIEVVEELWEAKPTSGTSWPQIHAKGLARYRSRKKLRRIQAILHCISYK